MYTINYIALQSIISQNEIWELNENSRTKEGSLHQSVILTEWQICFLNLSSCAVYADLPTWLSPPEYRNLGVLSLHSKRNLNIQYGDERGLGLKVEVGASLVLPHGRPVWLASPATCCLGGHRRHTSLTFPLTSWRTSGYNVISGPQDRLMGRVLRLLL